MHSIIPDARTSRLTSRDRLPLVCVSAKKAINIYDFISVRARARVEQMKIKNSLAYIYINFLFIFAAVKFGRMSKKQREKVEDEVRFHRAQMRAQNDAAPDSSVFDTQTPSSSDQLHHSYNG